MMREVYKERRDLMVEGLRELGWRIEQPKATIYIWAPVPKGYTSTQFAAELLEKAGVVVTPGNGYGECGEGYVRLSLCVEKERILEALQRLKNAGIRYS